MAAGAFSFPFRLWGKGRGARSACTSRRISAKQLEHSAGGSIMMKLYWSPRSRSFTALWLMEETGVAYERVLTDISTGAQRSLEFLTVNPMGKVPALQDGEATMAEAAAICAYVAER